MYTDHGRELWRNPAEAERAMRVNDNLEFGAVSCAIIVPNWLVGVLGFLSRLPVPTDQSFNRLNDFSSTNREPDFLGRTYVCFQLRLTDDRGTHAGKKGPLQYVNSAKVGEERARLRDGWQWAGSVRVNSSDSVFNLHAHWPLNLYLLSQERTSRQEETAGILAKASTRNGVSGERN